MISIGSLIGEKSDRPHSDHGYVPLRTDCRICPQRTPRCLRFGLYQGPCCPLLKERGMAELVCEIEAPLAIVIAGRWRRTVFCADPAELIRQGAGARSPCGKLRRRFATAAGFDFDLKLNQALAEALFDQIGPQGGKKTKTGRSTAWSVEKLAAKRIAKAADGRCHGSFWNTGSCRS